MVLPAGWVNSYASSITRGLPVVSMTTSAPFGPTISRICWAVFEEVAELIAWVSPLLNPILSFMSTISTPTMGLADTISAAWAMFMPTPPTPNITTDCPILISASLFTTPVAVVMAQPNNGARRSGKLSGITVRRFSDIKASSLNVVTHPALTVRPFQSYLGAAD